MPPVMVRKLTSTFSGFSSTGKARAIEDEEDYEGPALIARRMHLLLPNGPKKVTWDWFVIVLVLYNAYMIPFDLAFELCLGVEVLAIDIVVDTLFIIDCCLSFRTTFYDKIDGALVLDYARVRRNYLTSWFAIDFVASVPVEYIAFAVIGLSPLECERGHVSDSVQAATLFKIARLLRLGRLVKKFEKLAAAKAFRVLQLTITLLLVAHWFACIWYKVGASGEAHPDCTDDSGCPGVQGSSWIHRLGISDEVLGVKYFIAFYWALTMVMKSPWLAPASMAEFALASCMALVGSIIFAYFVGNVTAVITSSTQQANKYRDALGSLRTFARAHNLTRDTTTKLLSYYDALWTERRGGIDTQSILATVPDHLIPQVLIELHTPLLAYCPFLGELSLSGCSELLFALRVDVCDVNDNLLTAGTCPRAMYILWRGELQLSFPTDGVPGEVLTVAKFVGAVDESRRRRRSGVHEHEKARLVLEEHQRASKRGHTGRLDRPGTLVGFENVYAPRRAVDYTARAKARCTLFAIGRSAFKAVMDEFPSDFAPVLKAIKHSSAIIHGRHNNKTNASLRSVRPEDPRSSSLRESSLVDDNDNYGPNGYDRGALLAVAPEGRRSGGGAPEGGPKGKDGTPLQPRQLGMQWLAEAEAEEADQHSPALPAPASPSDASPHEMSQRRAKAIRVAAAHSATAGELELVSKGADRIWSPAVDVRAPFMEASPIASPTKPISQKVDALERSVAGIAAAVSAQSRAMSEHREMLQKVLRSVAPNPRSIRLAASAVMSYSEPASPATPMPKSPGHYQRC